MTEGEAQDTLNRLGGVNYCEDCNWMEMRNGMPYWCHNPTGPWLDGMAFIDLCPNWALREDPTP
jgi:hypothetical protein